MLYYELLYFALKRRIRSPSSVLITFGTRRRMRELTERATVFEKNILADISIKNTTVMINEVLDPSGISANFLIAENKR